MKNISIPIEEQVCNPDQAEKFNQLGLKLQSALKWYLMTDHFGRHQWEIHQYRPFGQKIKMREAYSLVELQSMRRYMQKQANGDKTGAINAGIWEQKQYFTCIGNYKSRHPNATNAELEAQVIIEAIELDIFKGDEIYYEP